MNDDLKLLQLAAKADGIEVQWSHVKLNWDGSHPIYWNPLNEDSHAFSLAIKLGMQIISVTKEDYCLPECVYTQPHTIVTNGGGRAVMSFVEIHGTDRNAATRRAIVKAAASLVS